MATTNTDYFAGRYILEHLFVTTEKGDQVDISNLMVEINVYASLGDITNVVTVTMTDALNVLGKLPIKGGCFLNFSMTYGDDTIEYAYRVTKVTNIITDSNQRAYTIEAISNFAYISMQHKISKSYTGTTSQIAIDILKEYSPNEKVLYWEKSRGVQTVVVPNWTPMGTVEWLAGRSIAEDVNITDSTFTFFQDSQGNYSFMPIPILKKVYQDEGSSFKFTLNSNKTVRKTDGVIEAPVSEVDYFSIDNLSYYDAFDITNAYRSGYLGGRAFNYDLVNKSFEDTKFDYFSSNREELLNSNTPYSKRDGRVNALHTFNYRSSFAHDNIAIDNVVTNSTTQIYDSLNKPIQSLTFETKGNAALDIGQIIELDIPSPEPYNKDNEDDSIDRSWSGRYYVTGIRNKFDKQDHVVILDVSKESLDSDKDL